MTTLKDSTAVQLPTPEERPDANLVIFDGNCRFCRGMVEKLARYDKRGRLAFISLHHPEVAQRFPDLKHDDLMQNMYVIDRQGSRHRGAASLRYLSTRLPALWPLAPLLHIPGTLPLWQWLYGKFAKRRYRFGRIESCDDGTCQIPRG